MKRISIVCLAGLFFLAACQNSGSSTVGTYEQEETSQSSEKGETEHGGHGKANKEHVGEGALKAPADTTVTEDGVSTDTSARNDDHH